MAVAILYRQREAASREVSATPPEVRVLYPNGGEILIQLPLLLKRQQRKRTRRG